MANRRVISRIQNRRGQRENLPQPLEPGEIAYTTDTRQVWIGADPDITPPGLVVYTNRTISTAQSILNTVLIEFRFDPTFSLNDFNTLRSLFTSSSSFTLTDDDFVWDRTFRTSPPNNFEGYGVYMIADQNVNVNHTLAQIQGRVTSSPVVGKLVSSNYVGNVTPFGGTLNSNGELSLFSHEQARTLIKLINRVYSGLGSGGLVRSNLNIEVVAGLGREGLNVDIQPTIGSNTIDQSLLTTDLQGRINLIDGPDTLPGSVAQRLTQEALARAAALEAEESARAAAILAEAQARQAALTQEANDRIQALQAEAQARAADLQAEANARLADFQAEELARNLAIAAEAQARADAIQAEATLREQAILNEAQSRATAISNEAATRTNAIAAETQDRINAVNNLDSTLRGQINSLQAEVSDLQGTPVFDSALDWPIDSIVKFGGGLYRALQSMTAPSPDPTNALFWEKIGDFASLGEAVASNSAIIGDHESRITVTENGLTTTNTNVTNLQTSVTGINNTKADITYVDQAVSNEESSRATALTSLETNLQGQIDTKASSTQLNTAVSDIYGSQVSAFTNIDARFNSTDNDLATKATQTDINNAVASVYAAEVTQFSNINAELIALDTAANSIVIGNDGSKSLGGTTFTSLSGDFLDVGVSPGDVLRIDAGADAGDYNIVTVDLNTQITIDLVGGWLSTATNVPYSVIAPGRVKATRTELNTAVADVYGAEVSQFTNIQAAFDNVAAPDLSSYATQTDLTTATANIYGANVEQFTNINARFSSTDDAINTKASITALNNAVAGVYGSEVSQFTEISAQFDLVDTAANAISRNTDGSKTATEATFTSTTSTFLVDGVAVGDTLRISSGSEQGDYIILTVDSETQLTLDLGVGGWTATETLLEFAVLTYNKIKATRTDLNTAVADVLGSEVTAFTNIDARFASTDNAIATKASSTDLTTAVSDIYGSQVSAFTNINARFSSTDTDIASKATQTDINTAVADVYGAQVSAFTNINAEFTSVNNDLASKATQTDINTAVADVYGATVESFTNINARFLSTDGTIATKASTTELNTAVSDIFGATVSQFTNIDARFTSVENDVATRATQTSLNTAISDVYGAQVNQFTNIDARFTSVENDVATRATQTALNTAVSDVYGAEVNQFTNISAEFQNLDTAINAIVIASDGAKTATALTFTSATGDFINNGVVAGDTLRITSGVEQGDYNIASVDSATQVTIVLGDLPAGWTTTESTVSYSILSFGNVKATRTELNTAVADVYGAQVSEFTNIQAAFDAIDPESTNNATLTDLTNLEASIYGAEVSQFTNIEAEFNTLDTAVNSVGNHTDGAKTAAGTTFASASATFITYGLAPGDVLRITSGAEQGDYTILTVDSENQLTLDIVGWSTTESNVEFSVLSYFKVKATRTELNDAVTDIFGAQVTEFTNINAEFTAVNNDLATKATQTDINNAVANVYGAEVSAFTNIDARFSSTDTAINTKASSTELNTAISNVYGAEVTAFTNINARFASTDTAISSKATQTDINTAVANVYGAQVSAFTNIDARFSSVEGDVATKASVQQLTDTETSILGAQVIEFTNINAEFTSVNNDLSSKASTLDLNTAISDVYGAQVSQFTNIDARFTTVENDVNTKATQTDINTAVADVFGAQVNEFTNISAEFSELDTEANAIVRGVDGSKSNGTLTFSSASASFLLNGVVPGDTLRIISGNQQGDYNIASVNSETSITISGTNWTSTESTLTYAIISYGRVKASRTELNTAVADVFGAEVTEFSQISARFISTDSAINSRVTQTDFAQAISDVYGAEVTQFTNISAAFTGVENTKADITFVNQAAADAEGNAIAQSTQTIYTDLLGPGATQSSVQTQATAWNGVSSQWEVKATVGELTAGIGLYNDAGTTRFAVQADNFLVYGASVPPTSADAIPFRVSNGQTFIKEAAIESLTADKITAGDISAALTMTGELVINTGGAARSGQTAYNTGTGWWLGNVGGTPRFSIGNSSGNRLTWDGTTLNVVGAITLTNTIPSTDVDGLGSLATKSTVNLATEVTNKSLANVDSAASSKLAGIDNNADVTLAAVNGELAVTGGGINFTSGTAAIRSGKTGYTSTANGFWIGRDAGTPKFHFGGSTKNIKWTGSDLIINGEVVATGNISNEAITTDKLDVGAVTAGKISAGAVTAAKINVDTLAALDATIGFLENRADGAGSVPYMRLTASASPIEIFDNGGSTGTRLLGVDTITTDGVTDTILSIKGTFAANSISDANWLSTAGINALRSRLGYIPPLNPSGGELSQTNIPQTTDPQTFTLSGTITSGGDGQSVLASLKLSGLYTENRSSDPGWVAPVYNVTFQYSTNGGSSWTTYGATQTISGTSTWFPGEPAEGILGVASVSINATAAVDSVLPGGAPATSYQWRATIDQTSGYTLRLTSGVEVSFFTVVEELVGDIQAHNHAATDITSGTLAVARGGTGINSYSTGNYIRASGSTTLEQRTPAQVRSDIGAGTGTVTSVSGGNGLSGTVTSSGSISMGTPGTLSTSTSNSVTSTSHTHAITGVEPTLATNRKRQIFVQSSTPSGQATGDLWIW